MNETKLDLNQNQNEVKVKREVKSRILNKYKNMQNNKNNKNNKYTFKHSRNQLWAKGGPPRDF